MVARKKVRSYKMWVCMYVRWKHDLAHVQLPQTCVGHGRLTNVRLL